MSWHERFPQMKRSVSRRYREISHSTYESNQHADTSASGCFLEPTFLGVTDAGASYPISISKHLKGEVMSIPSSSSYRSSSVGSTFTPEPHHAAAEDLLGPGGKLGAHIAAADSFQLLRVIGYLCESSHWINDDLKSSLGAAYQELEKKPAKTNFPVKRKR